MGASKRLLFLGAGASYGSENDTSIVPPLAVDLFDELLKFESNVWGQIPKNIADAFRADFEKGMLSLAAEMPHALTVTQRSMAAFFYRYAPTPQGLYGRLADRIKRHNWVSYVPIIASKREQLRCSILIFDSAAARHTSHSAGHVAVSHG